MPDDRLGVGAQAHLVHGEQDAPLHRFLAVGHLGQRAALDHADRVVEIRTFGVIAERQEITGRHGLVSYRGNIAWYRKRFTVPSDGTPRRASQCNMSSAERRNLWADYD